MKTFLHYLKKSITELRPDLIIKYLYWQVIPFGTVLKLKGIGKFKKSMYDDTLMTFFIDGRREWYLQELFANRWNRGTFIDVGANIGIFSVMAGNNKMKVIAFEPSNKNFSILKESFELNQVKNVSLFNKALGASGQVGYLSFAGSKSTVTIEDNTNLELIEFFDTEQLEGLIMKPVFCKIDVEGFEVNVLNEIAVFDFDEIIVEILDENHLESCLEKLRNYHLEKKVEDNYHFVKFP